jgi:1-deoxy-D-xylulose-5-phosphate synthase
MACGGLRPVCAIYSTFLQRAFDQIYHDVAIQHLPVVFALDRGGLVGSDGPTHHGTLDFAYLRPIPEMVVMAPKDEAELRQMLYTALQREDGPSAVRFPRGKGLGVSMKEPLKAIPLGQAEVLREGDDTCIWAIGAMVPNALKAADLLAERGIEATVINARFVKPLDEELLSQMSEKFSMMFSVEDHQVQGGFGSAICESLAAMGCYQTTNIPIGIPDRFIQHGSQDELYREIGLHAEGIAERIETTLQQRERRIQVLELKEKESEKRKNSSAS